MREIKWNGGFEAEMSSGREERTRTWADRILADHVWQAGQVQGQGSGASDKVGKPGDLVPAAEAGESEIKKNWCLGDKSEEESDEDEELVVPIHSEAVDLDDADIEILAAAALDDLVREDVPEEQSSDEEEAVNNPRPRRQRGRVNGLLRALRGLGVMADQDGRDRKHIADIYKFNTAEVRRQVLAGLMDSDGYYDRIGGRFHYVQCIDPHIQLFWDTVFLARPTESCVRVMYRAAKVYEVKEDHKLAQHGRYQPGDRTYGGPAMAATLSRNIELIPTLLLRKQALPGRHSDPDRALLAKIYKIRKRPAKEPCYGFVFEGEDPTCLGGPNRDFMVLHDCSTEARHVGVRREGESDNDDSSDNARVGAASKPAYSKRDRSCGGVETKAPVDQNSDIEKLSSRKALDRMSRKSNGTSSLVDSNTTSEPDWLREHDNDRLIRSAAAKKAESKIRLPPVGTATASAVKGQRLKSSMKRKREESEQRGACVSEFAAESDEDALVLAAGLTARDTGDELVQCDSSEME